MGERGKKATAFSLDRRFYAWMYCTPSSPTLLKQKNTHLQKGKWTDVLAAARVIKVGTQFTILVRAAC